MEGSTGVVGAGGASVVGMVSRIPVGYRGSGGASS